MIDVVKNAEDKMNDAGKSAEGLSDRVANKATTAAEHVGDVVSKAVTMSKDVGGKAAEAAAPKRDLRLLRLAVEQKNSIAACVPAEEMPEISTILWPLSSPAGGPGATVMRPYATFSPPDCALRWELYTTAGSPAEPSVLITSNLVTGS